MLGLSQCEGVDHASFCVFHVVWNVELQVCILYHIQFHVYTGDYRCIIELVFL